MAAKQFPALALNGWLVGTLAALFVCCGFEVRADWPPVVANRGPVILKQERDVWAPAGQVDWLSTQSAALEPPFDIHAAMPADLEIAADRAPALNLAERRDDSLQVKLASWFAPQYSHHQDPVDCRGCPWTSQWLPNGLIYKSYVAGEREPRFASTWLSEKDRGIVWDSALGGRVGIFRYGTPGVFRPQGWQVDFEGAVFARIDPDEHHDLEASDYRVGIPVTWSNGTIAVKAGYFHISSHLGDEFVLRNPGITRLNYVRDSLVFGIAYFPSDDSRVYFEIGYAPGTSGGAEPLEFQFGAEYSPVGIVCCGGAPFAAINGHIREEVNYGGSVNLVAGWQWRGRETNRLLRAGLQYFNGKSYVYEFFNTHEALTGFGLWVDY